MRVVVRAAAPRSCTRRAYLFRFLDHHGCLSVERLAAVAHRRRRVAQLRRARGQGAHRHRALDARCAACVGSTDRRRGPRRRRRRAPLRPRRSSRRTPTRRSALLADAHRGRACRARRVRVLGERDRAAHRRLAAPAQHTRALVVELPARPRATADADGVQVSYDMNRLQRLDEPSTTSSRSTPARASTTTRCSRACATRTRCTPPTSVAAQAPLPALTTTGSRSPARTTAGASTRTAALSGVRAAAVARGGVVTRPRALPARSRCCTATIEHDGAPVRARRSRTGTRCGWSTSTPCPGCRACCARSRRFDARDHLGDPTRAIRRNVDALLADAGHRPARRPRPHARQPALVRARVQPADRVLVLRRAHGAGLTTVTVRDRRGAQHLRRAALLPAPARRRAATPRPTRSSTSRRSSPSTAATRCGSPSRATSSTSAIALRRGDRMEPCSGRRWRSRAR